MDWSRGEQIEWSNPIQCMVHGGNSQNMSKYDFVYIPYACVMSTLYASVKYASPVLEPQTTN